MNYCNKFARMLIIGVLSCVGFSHYAATVPKSPTPTIKKYEKYVKVSWPAVEGATSYKLYRGKSKSFSKATLIYSGPKRTLCDISAEIGYKYYYWLQVRVDTNSSCKNACCCYQDESTKGNIVLYKTSDRAVGWRKIVLKVSEVRSGQKVYLKMSVNGRYQTTQYEITWSGVHAYHKYHKTPYICYFTSKRKGKGTWTVKFGKTKTVTASGTIKW